jgi:hypothetical protein
MLVEKGEIFVSVCNDGVNIVCVFYTVSIL